MRRTLLRATTALFLLALLLGLFAIGSPYHLHAAPALVDDCTGGARIDDPKPNATVRGLVRLVGTASTASFQRYEIAIARAGSTSFGYVSGGNAPVVNGVLYEWNTNPRDYPDGGYVLRVRAVKLDGNYDECKVAVRVDNSVTATPTGPASPTPGPATTPTRAVSPTPITVATPAVIGLASPTPAVTPRPAATATPFLGINISNIVDPKPWLRSFATGAILALAIVAFVGALFLARALFRWRP